jgi:hypothetical protein
MPHEQNSILNKEKLFELAPPKKIITSGLSLPKDWLTQLEKLCREVERELPSHCFNKHVGDTVDYPLKPILIEELQLIYYRLNGDFDASLGPLSESDRCTIISKLLEEITLCTEGFHNRINDIADALSKPNSLPELLYLVRIGLVKNLAVAQIKEIHAWNKITKIAANCGLGIKANFHDDPHPGNLSLKDKEIACALVKEFKEKYVPFNLPILLAEQLRGLLCEEGYIRESDGYTVGVAEKIANRINCFFSYKVKISDWEDFFIIDKDEENDFTNPCIRKLNWQLIRKSFFEVLVQEAYFTRPPSIASLLDCAYSSELGHTIPTDIEARYITELFQKSDYRQLRKIKNFQQYSEKLKQHPDFTHNTGLLIIDIVKTPFSCHCKLNLLQTLKPAGVNPSNLYALIRTLKKQEKAVRALTTAAQRQPGVVSSVVSPLLNFISDHSHHSDHTGKFDSQTLAKLLLEKDRDGNNLLMLAARYGSEILKPLLGFISNYIDEFDSKTLAEFFLKKESQTDVSFWNLAIADRLLEKYLTELDTAEKNFKETTTKKQKIMNLASRFFKFTASDDLQKERAAVLALKSALEKPNQIRSLSRLEKSYSVLKGGVSDKLIGIYYQLACAGIDRIHDYELYFCMPRL